MIDIGTERSHRYQANSPYRLALGDRAFQKGSVDFDRLSLPFLDVQIFPRTAAFVHWIASFAE